ncbi:RNA-binding S4 domain-containing protein [Aquibium sp. ELW1220]|uniref:RNA-binding S4 domain-containing protein n=1 Tax=Aquibium sp. ELW1220 TaxID=2976766 RepID=UPI0025B20ECC|nr:RNA-binding S4 domain-containing protein [Aquibium sp. ELW1220]MDN2579890.1 RNA-binding S4 domain-containing protein [Aquibium sp. ELW1220]
MAGPDRQRLDKWLFYARAVKSRSLAARLIQAGAVRVNREKVGQPSHPVKPGDGLTITLDRRILVWRVLETGTRRGPAEEARGLYEDLTPKIDPAAAALEPAPAAEREPGAGRPTKRERRLIDRWRGE